MGMHIVVIGNPIEGLTFFGPFRTAEEALVWLADHDIGEADRWVAPLRSQDISE